MAMATAMLTRLALPALRRRATPHAIISKPRTLLYPQWRSLSSSCAGAASQAASSPATDAKPSGGDPQAAALALLEKSIALRQSTRALGYLNQLEQLPSPRVLQKLAVLLAKQPSRSLSTRAFDLLLSVYKLPGFMPDDYTRLASIHVIDSCLRHRQLDRAMELYDEAFNQGVSLDLSAYDALLAALVENGRVDEAVEVLQDVAGHKDADPTEFSYQPVLVALVQDREYARATELLQQGEDRGVQFTTETFLTLVELAEADEDATDALVTFLSYIEDHWAEAKLLEDVAMSMDRSEDDEDDENDEDNQLE